MRNQENYKQALQSAVDNLVQIRGQLFDTTFHVTIAGELHEWDSEVAVGETFTFSKELFAACDDSNVQLLVELLNRVEKTCDTLINLNNLTFPEHD